MFNLQHPAKQKFLPGFLGALVQATPKAMTDYVERQVAAAKERTRQEEALAELGIKSRTVDTAAQRAASAQEKDVSTIALNKARANELAAKEQFYGSIGLPGSSSARPSVVSETERVLGTGQTKSAVPSEADAVREWFDNLPRDKKIEMMLRNPAFVNAIESGRRTTQQEAHHQQTHGLHERQFEHQVESHAQTHGLHERQFGQQVSSQAQTHGQHVEEFDYRKQQDKLNQDIAEDQAVLKQKNREEDIGRTQTKEQEEAIAKSFDKHAEYMSKIRADRAAADAQEADFDIMNQLIDSNGLTDSRLVNLANAIGFPLGLLGNPTNEEYEKKALNITKNIISEYGNRPLLQEFQVLLKRIPSLMNTDEGKRQIIEDMRVIQKIARLRSDTLEDLVQDAKDKGKPLPRDLEGDVHRIIKDDVKKAYDWIKQRNGRIKVAPGTPITDKVIDQYLERYRDLTTGKISHQNELDAEAAAREDGYDI